jgi:hypothetical protein
MVHDPTAVHAIADVHDTLASELSFAPASFGIWRIDHREPLLLSTSATLAPARFVEDPTAMQNPLIVHETPARGTAVRTARVSRALHLPAPSVPHLPQRHADAGSVAADETEQAVLDLVCATDAEARRRTSD